MFGTATILYLLIQRVVTKEVKSAVTIFLVVKRLFKPQNNVSKNLSDTPLQDQFVILKQNFCDDGNFGSV